MPMVQEAAVPLVFNQQKRAHVVPRLINLHWPPMDAKSKVKTEGHSNTETSWQLERSRTSSHPSSLPPLPLRLLILHSALDPLQQLTSSIDDDTVPGLHLCPPPLISEVAMLRRDKQQQEALISPSSFCTDKHTEIIRIARC
ncbi:unnamed protein product [Pleuronectes platessa]|uniref:Uncharacterized protein n=1 Tax=Pleuronectes platessa TaxID=8262 RepID=A0A9N7VSB2_PLEPL|nr:unnamed protein product [Pleuronectes platessa]